MKHSLTPGEWNARNRANIAAVRARSGGAIDVCPECHAVVEVRYTPSLAGWLMQTRKSPEHMPTCSAFATEVT